MESSTVSQVHSLLKVFLLLVPACLNPGINVIRYIQIDEAPCAIWRFGHLCMKGSRYTCNVQVAGTLAPSDHVHALHGWTQPRLAGKAIQSAPGTGSQTIMYNWTGFGQENISMCDTSSTTSKRYVRIFFLCVCVVFLFVKCNISSIGFFERSC